MASLLSVVETILDATRETRIVEHKDPVPNSGKILEEKWAWATRWQMAGYSHAVVLLLLSVLLKPLGSQFSWGKKQRQAPSECTDFSLEVVVEEPAIWSIEDEKHPRGCEEQPVASVLAFKGSNPSHMFDFVFSFCSSQSWAGNITGKIAGQEMTFKKAILLYEILWVESAFNFVRFHLYFPECEAKDNHLYKSDSLRVEDLFPWCFCVRNGQRPQISIKTPLHGESVRVACADGVSTSVNYKVDARKWCHGKLQTNMVLRLRLENSVDVGICNCKVAWKAPVVCRCLGECVW